MSTQKRRAIALISGGLDSMLAAQLMLDQGIHVEGINFFTGFCVEGHTHAIRRRDKDKPKRNNALWAAKQLGIKLHIIDIVEEYKDVVINPKHGYGSLVNPCLDCKVFMVKKAHEWMQNEQFDFIITGEVIGQRPKSQRKINMPIVSTESGAFDRLLRPLCAQNLPETLPERAGWVDRMQLLGITGRSRSAQIALAEKYKFDDYAQPAGGCCFLTDKYYATKLQDLWQSRGIKKYELDDIMLLKVGRHIRPNKASYKLIVGRDEGENNYLEGYKKSFVHFRTLNHTGPLVLLEGEANQEDLIFAARIAARFGDGKTEDLVRVQMIDETGREECFQIQPLKAEEILKEWYV